MSSKEIAQKLEISPYTVDAYLRTAIATLGVQSRTEAARILASVESDVYPASLAEMGPAIIGPWPQTTGSFSTAHRYPAERKFDLTVGERIRFMLLLLAELAICVALFVTAVNTAAEGLSWPSGIALIALFAALGLGVVAILLVGASAYESAIARVNRRVAKARVRRLLRRGHILTAGRLWLVSQGRTLRQAWEPADNVAPPGRQPESIPLTVIITAPGAFDWRLIERLLEGFQDDIDRRALPFSKGGAQFVQLADARYGSWFLRVFVPVAGLSLTAGSFCLEMLKSLEEPHGVFATAAQTLFQVIDEAGAAGARVDVAGREAIVLVQRDRRIHVLPGQGQPKGDEEPQVYTRVGDKHPSVIPKQFLGRVLRLEETFVEAPDVASYAFPIYDWRRPPRKLGHDRFYLFDALIRYDRHEAVIGAFVRSAKPRRHRDL